MKRVWHAISLASREPVVLLRRFGVALLVSSLASLYVTRFSESRDALVGAAFLLVLGSVLVPFVVSRSCAERSASVVVWWSALLIVNMSAALLHDAMMLFGLRGDLTPSLMYAEAAKARKCLALRHFRRGRLDATHCDATAAERTLAQAKQTASQDAVLFDADVVRADAEITAAHLACEENQPSIQYCQSVQWHLRPEVTLQCADDCVPALPLPGDCFESCMRSGLKFSRR